MKFPSKPSRGEKALQSIYNTVCQICDYLPTLNVVGDNKTTYVNHSAGGQVVHAIQPNTILPPGNGQTYYAGSGIVITSGNIINAKLSAGPNIKLDYNSGWIVISGTPAGSGTSPGPGPGPEYKDGRFITISSDNSINCTLSALSELYNPPFVQSASIVMPNSLTACNNTVDISQVGQIYSNHFIQTRDILYDGVGTKVSLAWMRNPFGDLDPGGTNGIIEGLQVDLTLSGGRFADVVLHKHVYGAYDPDTGTRYDPPTESRVDCLLTGTYDHYPHTSGFIDVVPVEMEDGKTWGVISTNLHGDGTTIDINPTDGTISCKIDPGGTTIIASGVTYPNYQELHKDDYGYVSGIGISFMLPVQSGANVCFYTGAGSEHAFATFAASELNADDQYQRATIYNGEPYQTSAAGWVRLSVFDDGTNEGECLEFTDSYTDSSSWNYSTPLYRFHGFKALSGDGTTIDVVGNTISGKYYGDGTYIQVDGAQIKFIGTIGGGFKAPKYNLLNLGSSDAGIAASGLGTTYLVPVSKGSSIWYEGTATVAIWVPVEGSEVTQRHNVPNTSNSAWSTTDDGYVRLTVFDDGSNPGGCLKLHVGSNGVLPLHKYSAALSGAAGIAIENNGIRNMIQPGTGLTSSALEDSNHVMTGISFDLSAQYAADLASISGRLSATTNEDRILSSHNGTLLWAENTASYTPPSTVYDLLSQGSGIQLTKLSNGKTKIDCTVQGGGGGTIINNGIPWPNYQNLSNYSSTVSVGTDYTAGPNGGWLRVSYKGRKISDCYGVQINGHPVGLYCTQWGVSLVDGNEDPVTNMSAGISGMIGCTWLIPVPPKQRFYIEFPSDCTYAYFDSAKYSTSEVEYDYSAICGYVDTAKNNRDEAQDKCWDAWYYANDLKDNWDYYSETHDISDLWSVGTYQGEWRDASGRAIDAVDYADTAAEAANDATNEYNYMIENQTDIMGDAIEYKTSAIAYAEEAAAFATSAVQGAQRAYDYYLSACNAYNVQPEEY